MYEALPSTPSRTTMPGATVTVPPAAKAIAGAPWPANVAFPSSVSSVPSPPVTVPVPVSARAVLPASANTGAPSGADAVPLGPVIVPPFRSTVSDASVAGTFSEPSSSAPGTSFTYIGSGEAPSSFAWSSAMPPTSYGLAAVPLPVAPDGLARTIRTSRKPM